MQFSNISTIFKRILNQKQFFVLDIFICSGKCYLFVFLYSIYVVLIRIWVGFQLMRYKHEVKGHVQVVFTRIKHPDAGRYRVSWYEYSWIKIRVKNFNQLCMEF